MKYILQLINKIQYEYETEQKKYNLTLTGIDEAAKIANVLATLVGCNVKGFFTNEPKNISISLDFSEIDLGFFSENLNYFPDILTKTLSEGAEFEGRSGAIENIFKRRISLCFSYIYKRSHTF